MESHPEDDLHHVVLIWPRTDAKEVLIQGEWDDWGTHVPMTRTDHGFETEVKVPWGKATEYKFLVDGEWRLSELLESKTDYDPSGKYLNNTYTAPPKPVGEAAVAGVAGTKGNAARATVRDAPVVPGSIAPPQTEEKPATADSQPTSYGAAAPVVVAADSTGVPAAVPEQQPKAVEKSEEVTSPTTTTAEKPTAESTNAESAPPPAPSPTLAPAVTQQPKATPPMSTGGAGGAGGNRNAMNVPVQDSGKREWSFELFGCFEDINTCVLACCCPCISYGHLKARIDSLEATGQAYGTPLTPETAINSDCGLFCALQFCYVGVLLQAANRVTARARYNLSGEGGTEDYLVACCCFPCDVTQVSREVQLEEESLVAK